MLVYVDLNDLTIAIKNEKIYLIYRNKIHELSDKKNNSEWVDKVSKAKQNYNHSRITWKKLDLEKPLSEQEDQDVKLQDDDDDEDDDEDSNSHSEIEKSATDKSNSDVPTVKTLLEKQKSIKGTSTKEGEESTDGTGDGSNNGEKKKLSKTQKVQNILKKAAKHKIDQDQIVSLFTEKTQLVDLVDEDIIIKQTTKKCCTLL
eukprot:TRINITY_DN1255_c2_g1_i4.p2 TRINITY_DN1255_c2_g1~~TRINITY_DN1255_c2_g1_i4.p2  ORF type:complete len:202 (+),score=58.33 TRINITY_DN1255_c2_g1_i4:981-1586(+)